MSTRFKSRISFFIISFLFSYLIAHGAIRFTNVTNKFGVKGYSYFVGHGIRWIDAISDGKLDIYVKSVGTEDVLSDINNSNWIRISVTDHTRSSGCLGSEMGLYLSGYLDQNSGSATIRIMILTKG